MGLSALCDAGLLALGAKALMQRPITPIPSALHAVAEDEGCPLGYRRAPFGLVPAVVVDVQDVQRVDRPGEEAEYRQRNIDHQVCCKVPR